MTTMLRVRAAIQAGRAGGARARLGTVLEQAFLWVHPPTVRRATLAFRHTYCLGAIVLSVWSVLIATGALMMFHIRPAVPDIYHDITELTFGASHGAFIRSMHRWAASAMVAAVVLHMLRVFFHRAYRRPRRGTWWLGVGLLAMVFASSYTGYLLPWDQRAYWGVSVGAGMANEVPVLGAQIRAFLLGGPQIGSHTVLRFYVVHCVVLPAIMVLLVVAHLRRIRQAGVQGPGPANPPAAAEDVRQDPVDTAAAARSDRGRGADEQVKAFPHLLIWELTVFQCVVIALALIALAAQSPLDEIANPVVTPDPVKAPWYLVGLQESLRYYPPVVVGVVFPSVLTAALVLVPVYSSTFAELPLAAWPVRSVRRYLAIVAAAATAVFVWRGAWVALVPTLVVIALALWVRRMPEETRGLAGWLRRRAACEWIMIWLVMVGGASTIIGTFFRGPGWSLVWPAGIAWFLR